MVRTFPKNQTKMSVKKRLKKSIVIKLVCYTCFLETQKKKTMCLWVWNTTVRCILLQSTIDFFFTLVNASFILGRNSDFQILLDGFLLGCAKILDMVTRSPYKTRLGVKLLVYNESYSFCNFLIVKKYSILITQVTLDWVNFGRSRKKKKNKKKNQ